MISMHAPLEALLCMRHDPLTQGLTNIAVVSSYSPSVPHVGSIRYDDWLQVAALLVEPSWLRVCSGGW
jgi:hypothetical protein